MARQTLERVVRDYVAEGSGMNGNVVIPSKGKGTSPAETYATVLLFTDRQLGINSTDRTIMSDEVERRTKSTRELVYSVQWLRDGAGDLAERFRAWAGSPDGREWATMHGLTYVECSEIRDLSDKWADSYEERVGLDLTLCIESTFDSTVGPVRIIPLTVPENPQSEITAT